MAAQVRQGTVLWEPSQAFQQQSRMGDYMRWLERERGLRFASYDELWRWSVESLEDFWATIWDYFDVRAPHPYSVVLEQRTMPGARWFVGAELSYAEHAFRYASDEHPAILFQSERHPLTETSWAELRRQVASVAAWLREQGVQPGDRIVAYMPNIPQTVAAFLAAASIGATWSSCSPDFGTRSVIDRFAQIEPTILFAVDGYSYNGKRHDRRDVVAEIQAALPTLKHTVLVPYLDDDATTGELSHAVLWHDVVSRDEPLTFAQLPFDHPLWILYSSGTTGLPKPILQSQGGILLEHLKVVGLHTDIRPGSRLFWFTTTGWMMWNFVLGGLLAGGTIVLYDGSPAYPDAGVVWQLAQDSGMTVLGASPGLMAATQRAGIAPGECYDLSKLASIGSTGSPLPVDLFVWVYEHVKRDLWLASVSGGTDVCTGFLLGSPLLPVRAGELQCRALGANVQAFDESGQPLVDQVGELVITEPMPSMPLRFWNDHAGARYRAAYFEMYPGIWRHGDWIKITPDGGTVIYGRSDSTLNRHGVRMGSSDIYSVVEGIPEVLDSLILGIELQGGGYYMPLFVVLEDGVALDDALKAKIKRDISTNLSPRHVPDDIVQITEVPRTLNGKKLEVPIKKLFVGVPLEKAVNPGSVASFAAVEFFIAFARDWREKMGSVLPQA